MIHQTAVIGSGAKIGANVEIGPHSVIGGAVTIGDDCVIGANVVIEGEVSIGQSNRIGHGAITEVNRKTLVFRRPREVGSKSANATSFASNLPFIVGQRQTARRRSGMKIF